MRHLSKGAVLVGLGAFLVALLWWLPAPALAGSGDCAVVVGPCLESGLVKKFVPAASWKRLVKLASQKYPKAR